MAGFTTGQANANLQQLVNTPAEYSGDVQDLARSQRLAELLTAGKPAEGQMVSGRFVAPSWTQHLAGLAQAGLGAYYGDKAETQQSKLAEKLRQDKAMTQEGIMTAINSGDMKKALAIASTRPEYGKEFIAPLLGNVIPKAASPTTEMQNYNFAKTPEGGGFKGTFGQYQKEQANLKDIQSSFSPVESNGQIFAMNSKTAQLVPLKDASGQPLMGTKGNLPEGATKQVTGATNLKDAIINYKDTLTGFNTLDMVNPDARAKMGNAYNNMMLQAKEAYNLGVLNGPDYAILQSVVKDPTKLNALLTSKDALQSQATDLSKQADKIIENVYKTHNRTVPASLQTPTAPAAPAKKGGIPAGITPAEWNAMSPADRKLFE
jgi:hypothetical protein